MLRGIIFLLITTGLAPGCAADSGTDVGTQQEGGAMNHYLWVEYKDSIDSTACRGVVIESDLIAGLLSETKTDHILGTSADGIKGAIKNSGVKDVGEFMAARCVSSPVNPRQYGFSSLEDMIEHYFVMNDKGTYFLRGIIPEGKPCPNSPEMIAAYIQDGYRVWITDAAPVIYLTRRS